MAKKRGHGEGTIYQRTDGRWTAQVTVEIDAISKKQIRKTVYGKSKKDVMEKMLALQHQKQIGINIDAKKITVGEWLDRWLEDYMKGKLRIKTWESYDSLIRNHIKPSLGSIILQKLQAVDIQRMYNAKLSSGRLDGKGGVSNRTVRYIHAILRASFKQALRDDLLFRNIVEATVPPCKVKKEINVLTQEQMALFLKSAKDDRLFPAFLLELGTGLRRGELMGLKWSDIDLDSKILQVKQSLVTINRGMQLQEPKTSSSQRCIPLPDETVKVLKKLKATQNEEKLKLGEIYQDEGYVFCWKNGQVVNPNILSRRFKAILGKAGLPVIRFHDLRHTHATNLLLCGENPKVVQERLGHSSISVTMDVYSHVSKGMQESASQKIDLMLKEIL